MLPSARRRLTGIAIRFFALAAWGLCCCCFAVLFGCDAGHSETKNPSEGAGVVSESVPFVDCASTAGLVFQHANGMTGQRYMVEMVGPGCALFDFDRDGDLDAFLVQGRPLGPAAMADDPQAPRHQLFRNDLIPERNEEPSPLHFTDISQDAGLTFTDYGMGVAAGDFDGDGWIDLFLTCFGENRLLRNTGRGTLEDVTSVAGLAAEPAWSTSAAWVDFDRDGRLDLFVCRYLIWDYSRHKRCASQGGTADYCGPKSFEPARSRLYRNLGGGRFADVSRESRVSSIAGASLGVVAADVDDDGWPDLFVANDGMPNFLWVNQRDGTFRNEASPRGCAVNAEGTPEANMGLIAADFRNVGRLDLFITHLRNEHSTYFENLGAGQFADVTIRRGLDATTRPFTGFGTVAIDYDNDGWLDIFSANGEVRIIDTQFEAGISLPMRQRSLLLRNLGGPSVRFSEVCEGEFVRVEEVGRGLAAGDLDNDGDLDLVLSNNAGPTRLLLNQVGQSGRWLGLQLLHKPADHPVDALGAIVRLQRADGWLVRRSATDGSYLASSDPRVLFGLAGDSEVERIVVTWPDGQSEQFPPPSAINTYQTLTQGSGVPLTKPNAAEAPASRLSGSPAVEPPQKSHETP